MTYDKEILDLAAEIEASGTAETVHLPEKAGRAEMQRAIHAQRERLAADCEQRQPRAAIRCHEGCRLFNVYDVPPLGPVVVKRPMTRGLDHAEREAQDHPKSTLIAAPVEALIVAAGGQLIGGLLACEEHLEASVSPDALRWLATQRGTFTVDPASLPHNEIDVRVGPGLTGGDITMLTEGIANPETD